MYSKGWNAHVYGGKLSGGMIYLIWSYSRNALGGKGVGVEWQRKFWGVINLVLSLLVSAPGDNSRGTRCDPRWLVGVISARKYCWRGVVGVTEYYSISGEV
jgi:hypothetical protein